MQEDPEKHPLLRSTRLTNLLFGIGIVTFLVGCLGNIRTLTFLSWGAFAASLLGMLAYGHQQANRQRDTDQEMGAQASVTNWTNAGRKNIVGKTLALALLVWLATWLYEVSSLENTPVIQQAMTQCTDSITNMSADPPPTATYHTAQFCATICQGLGTLAILAGLAFLLGLAVIPLVVNQSGFGG